MIDPSTVAIMLEATIPFLIHDLAERGGPGEREWAFLREVGKAEYETPVADMAQFPGSATTKAERQQVSDYWKDFRTSIAIMAFCPGGIKICGTHFSAGMPDITGKRSEVVGVFPQTREYLDAISEAILEARNGEA